VELMIHVPEALDAERAHRLADAVEASDDPVIVLIGGPDTFCRGMDFAALVADEPAIRIGVEAFARAVRAIRTASRPVIAVVEGAALGGGVGIAAAADLVLATSHATFGLPEALFGLVPGVVMPVLLERMVPQKARWLALTGHARSAAEALELGLIDAMVAEDRLEAAVRHATRQLSRAGSGAVGSLKRAFDDVAIARGVAETTRLLCTPEVGLAVRAFLDGDWPQ
jgi:enoyl-CoA hydratase/carnithine racemase